ncbi:MAG TPA: nuclear transport factor 2 family protein [Acidimicrobiales bacterium]|jgi:ketosteroid isomerase-like protein|nr:nuclear transport factor 2 family protein [Acidimicrobiales bacterium]
MRPDEVAGCEAVRQCIARYAHAVDHGRFDDAARCFADDGVLDVRGSGRHEGRAAIASVFAVANEKLTSTSTSAFVRHHVSSIAIEVDVTAGRASAVSYFFAVTDVGPDHWGAYRDSLARDDASGQWLFTERKVTVEGRTGPSRMT